MEYVTSKFPYKAKLLNTLKYCICLCVCTTCEVRSQHTVCHLGATQLSIQSYLQLLSGSPLNVSSSPKSHLHPT